MVKGFPSPFYSSFVSFLHFNHLSPHYSHYVYFDTAMYYNMEISRFMNKCRLNKQQKGYKKISGDIFQQDINSDLKKQQNGKIIPRLEANGKITPLLEAKGKLQGE